MSKIDIFPLLNSAWTLSAFRVICYSVAMFNSLQPHEQGTPSPVFHCLPEFAQIHSIESMMLPNYLILCHPQLWPSIFPRIRVVFNESVLRIGWTKHWSFSFSISPSNECSWLISFRVDWFDLIVVQGTLKSLL